MNEDKLSQLAQKVQGLESQLLELRSQVDSVCAERLLDLQVHQTREEWIESRLKALEKQKVTPGMGS